MLLKRLFYLITVPGILLAVTLYISQKPYYNWDMFPYMTLAMCGDDSLVPFNNCHARIYEEARSKMIPSDFDAIALRQPLLRSDWQAFQDILKYYQIKPGYNVLVKDFYSMGFNVLVATYLPSVISYFFIGCLLLWWMLKIFSPPIAGLVTLICGAAPFLVQTARYSSPDMLCAAILLGGVFLIYERSTISGLLVCTIAILVRPDVIFILSLAVALLLAKRIGVKTASGFTALALVVTFYIVSPAMMREFLFTIPSYSPSWSFGETITSYFSGLLNGLSSFVSFGSLIFVLLSAITLYLRRRLYHKPLKDFWSLLLLAALASFIVRYFFHPMMEDRFQIATYLIVILGFCTTITDVFPKYKAQN